MNGIQEIEKHLDRVRGAVLRQAFAESLLVCVLSVTILLIGAVLFSNLTDELQWVRLGALTMGFFAVSASLFLRWGRTLLWTREPRNLALHAERTKGHKHNEIVTALEFGRKEIGAIEDQGLSPRLLQETLNRATKLLQDLPSEKVVDREFSRSMRRYLGIVVGLLCVSLLWTPSPYQAGIERLVLGPPQTSREDTAAQDIPVDILMGDVDISYTYPAYSRLPPRAIQGSSGDITALAGTAVVINARPLHGVTQVSLVLDDETEIPMQVLPDGRMEGSLTLSHTSGYRFRGENRFGKTLIERGERSIEVQEDFVPEVALLSPDTDVEVNLEDQVTLIFQASDDFGLNKIEVAYRNLRLGETTRILAQRLDSERVHRGMTKLDIPDTHPEPGDTLEVWIEAYDQDTVNGPKVGQSASRKIKIWSPQEKHDELVDELGEIIEVLLSLLADRLESPLEAADTSTYTPGLALASTINTKTQAFVDTMEAILADLAEDPLMPETVRQQLSSMRQRHLELSVSEGHVLRKATLRHFLSAELARLLYVHNDENIVALEKDTLLLEDLVDRLRQDKLLDQTRDLMAQQDELMRLLDALKGENSQENNARAQAALDQLQNQLTAMMNELAKQAKQLPYENFNPGALDPEGTQADVQDFRSQLDEIRDMLARGDIEGAMKAAEALQKKMAEMMATMEEGFDGLPMASGDGEMQRKLQEVSSSVGEIAREEQRIFRETSAVNDDMRKALEELRKEKLDSFFQEQREKVAKVRDKLSQVNQEGMDERDLEKLDGLKDAARDLEDLLGQQDIDRSGEVAESVARECDGLGNALGEGAQKAEERAVERALKKDEERARGAGRLAKQIASDLKSLIPDPNKMLTEEDRRKLKKLNKAQEKNRQRLSSLEKEIDSMESMGPALEGSFSELLEEAGKSMEGAGEKLGQGQPRPAARAEESALDRLGRAQKRLQQMMQPGQRKPGAGTGLSNQDTNIPDPEDYTVPAEFRDEVMKAMRENAPARYKERIEGYYEELMR